VLIDFKVVYGSHYAQLHRMLAGNGISDLHSTLEEIALAPLLHPLRKLMDPSGLKKLSTIDDEDEFTQLMKENLDSLRQAGQAEQNAYSLDLASENANLLIENILKPQALSNHFGLSAMESTRMTVDEILEELEADHRKQYIILLWA
jgi:hypothetical protein